MGSGKRLYDKIPDTEFAVVPARAGLDRVYRSPAVHQKVVQRPSGCIHRNMELAGEHIDAGDVVPVFMGHEDRTDIIRLFASTDEAEQYLFCR